MLARTPGDISVGRDPVPDFHLPGNSDWRGTAGVPLLGLMWLVSPPSLESCLTAILQMGASDSPYFFNLSS